MEGETGMLAIKSGRVEFVKDRLGGKLTIFRHPNDSAWYTVGADAAKQAQGYRPPVPPPTVDYTAIPAPPRQPSMPNAATAPARPAIDMPPSIDPGAYRVPTG